MILKGTAGDSILIDGKFYTYNAIGEVEVPDAKDEAKEAKVETTKKK